MRAVENVDAGSFYRTEVSKAYLEHIYGGDVKKCAASEGSVPKAVGKAKSFLQVPGITSELLVEHPGFAAVAALEGIVERAKKHCGG